MNLFKSMLKKLQKERSHLHFPPVLDNPEIVKGTERFNPYPAKTFLGEQNLHAYYLIFMLKHDSFLELQALLASRFGNQELSSDTILRNENQEVLALSYRQEFGGIIVEATTNSMPLIRALDARFPAPPPPWSAFPNMEPIEAAMNKQGSLEYWWNRIWLPFWSTRTLLEKEEYLMKNDVSVEWREVLT